MKTINRLSNKYLYFIFVLLGLFPFLQLSAQSGKGEQVNPVGIKTTDNGRAVDDPKEEPIGALFDGNAPMEVMFEARIEAPDTITWRSEWQISRSEEFETIEYPLYDDNIKITFVETGAHYVRLLVTFSDNHGNQWDVGENDYFTISIAESILNVPNAFSPNGDGINDLFKVTHKSLVKFNATIFNRWGQEIHHWNLTNIDEGWDGTRNGKPVKDGVYFIVIEAVGAEGKKYTHKGDINLLRGFSGNGSTSPAGGGE